MRPDAVASPTCFKHLQRRCLKLLDEACAAVAAGESGRAGVCTAPGGYLESCNWRASGLPMLGEAGLDAQCTMHAQRERGSTCVVSRSCGSAVMCDVRCVGDG